MFDRLKFLYMISGGGGRVAPHVFGWYGGSATVLVSIRQLLRSCELARFKANHLTARFADLLALMSVVSSFVRAVQKAYRDLDNRCYTC